eukprot:scaffold1525_cov142-Cylindrotheca_fusiformis.AAC.117
MFDQEYLVQHGLCGDGSLAGTGVVGDIPSNPTRCFGTDTCHHSLVRSTSSSWVDINLHSWRLLKVMTWLQLANKTAIVTGAASGIGAAGEFLHMPSFPAVFD